MAVVTTTFSTTAGQVWASPTWSSNDPSKKVHDQLVAWVNAINDPTKIELIHSPGDATARGVSDPVRWLLRAREAETSTDYGIRFADRYAGTGDTGDPGIYYGRSAGSGNNGSGSYSVLSPSGNGWTGQSGACSHFTAYEATGTTPWFVYASKIDSSGIGSFHYLQRLSIANMTSGSYYPSSGLGKWMYAVHNYSNWVNSPPTILTPQANLSAPYKGINATSTSATALRYPQPKSSTGDGYFFRLAAQYGDTHFLGEPTYDILVSNSATGVWADTVVINSITYTRMGLGQPFWVRTS